MDKEVLTTRITELFNGYEDKQNLSFKKVKQLYTDKYSELESADSKLAKKLIMKLYIEYQEASGESTVLTENKPVMKRPREKSEEKTNFDEVEDKENMPVNKPGKKQKMDANAALEVTFKNILFIHSFNSNNISLSTYQSVKDTEVEEADKEPEEVVKAAKTEVLAETESKKYLIKSESEGEDVKVEKKAKKSKKPVESVPEDEPMEEEMEVEAEPEEKATNEKPKETKKAKKNAKLDSENEPEEAKEDTEKESKELEELVESSKKQKVVQKKSKVGNEMPDKKSKKKKVDSDSEQADTSEMESEEETKTKKPIATKKKVQKSTKSKKLESGKHLDITNILITFIELFLEIVSICLQTSQIARQRKM